MRYCFQILLSISTCATTVRDAARVADRRSAVSDVELALALTSSTGAPPPVIAWPEQSAVNVGAAAAAARACAEADSDPGPLLVGAIVRCRAAAARPADEAEHGNILRQWLQISLAAASGVAGRGLHSSTFPAQPEAFLTQNTP